MIRARRLRWSRKDARAVPPGWLVGVTGILINPLLLAQIECVLLWHEGQHTGAVRYRWSCHGRGGSEGTLDAALRECWIP